MTIGARTGDPSEGRGPSRGGTERGARGGAARSAAHDAPDGTDPADGADPADGTDPLDGTVPADGTDPVDPEQTRPRRTEPPRLTPPYGFPAPLPYGQPRAVDVLGGGYGSPDVSAQVIPGARWSDLDPVEFERLRRLVGASRAKADPTLADLPDLALARELGVVRDRPAPRAGSEGRDADGGRGGGRGAGLLARAGRVGGAAERAGTRGSAGDADDASRVEITLAGLLLFGRPPALRRFVPNHEAAFQVLDGPAGLDAGVNDFFRWPLLRLAEELLVGFRGRVTEQEVRFELVRLAVPSYSESAFRELLGNALIHRDYTVPGAVHIRWDAEQLEISSPAGLPDGLTADRLLTTPPRPRNPLLADALRRAGIAGRTGRGVSRAYYEQLRFGHAPPDFARSDEHTVLAVLPGGPADLAFARFVLGQEMIRRPLTLPDLQVIASLRQRPRVRTADVATLLGSTKTEARRRLFRMVSRGLVDIQNADSAQRSWALSGYVREALRDSAVHVAMQRHERAVRRAAERAAERSARDAARSARSHADAPPSRPGQAAAPRTGPPAAGPAQTGPAPTRPAPTGLAPAAEAPGGRPGAGSSDVGQPAAHERPGTPAEVELARTLREPSEPDQTGSVDEATG